MAVMTVNGIVDGNALGITAPHEHAFIDIRNQYTGSLDSDSEGWRGKVTCSSLSLLLANPYAMRDNLILDDEDLCVSEVKLAVQAGLKTFVDATPKGVGRDPLFLRRLSDKTGLHVVAGCGLYTQDTHPARVKDQSEEAIALEFIRDLTVGMDETDVCAGIIGELGTGEIVHPNEKKVLRAAAIAHIETGAPLMIHLYPWSNNGLIALDVLEEAGVNPERVCLCHTDVPLETDYMLKLLKRGAYVEFDDFGKEFSIDVPYGSFPSDDQRLLAFYRLADAGYADRLLASCDICLKVLYTAFGGKGYAHVLKGVADKICEQRGDAKYLLNMVLEKNPARYLDNPKLTPKK